MKLLLTFELLLAIFVKAKSKGRSICKIVNLLVSNFASVLFDFYLNQRLVKQTDANLLTINSSAILHIYWPKYCQKASKWQKNHICKWTFSYFNFCHNRWNRFSIDSVREGDRELERRAKTQGNLVSGKGCYCGGISRGFLILWAKPEKRGALMHRQLFFRDLTTLDSKQAKVSGGAMFSQLTQLTVSHCPCLKLFSLLWHTCFSILNGK